MLCLLQFGHPIIFFQLPHYSIQFLFQDLGKGPGKLLNSILLLLLAIVQHKLNSAEIRLLVTWYYDWKCVKFENTSFRNFFLY